MEQVRLFLLLYWNNETMNRSAAFSGTVNPLLVGFGRATRIHLSRLINTQNRALRAPPPSQLRCFSFIHQCA
jgi:hypothetical protein